MKNISICVTLGTRPEAIKLAPVIQKLRSHPKITTHLVLTGQHKEMVSQVMELFELEADYNLEIMQAKQTLTEITWRSLQGLEEIFNQIKPQLLIVQGDTSTAFAAALAGFYQKIAIAHVEAGLRTNDLFNPYPEEANRRLISQIAQLHFAPTAAAVDNLKKSGVTGEIHQTGNTVIDALLAVAATSPPCDLPGLNWQQYKVLLTTIHRRENWGLPLQQIIQALNSILAKHPDTALLLPLHRNPTVREPLQKAFAEHPRVYLCEPLDYSKLVGAIQRCYFLLTDSGGLQEEAPSLGKPVLVLRETTERPEAIAAGTAKLVGTNPEAIVTAASNLLTDEQAYQKMATAVNPFGDGLAAKRIINLIEKYFQDSSFR